MQSGFGLPMRSTVNRKPPSSTGKTALPGSRQAQRAVCWNYSEGNGPDERALRKDSVGEKDLLPGAILLKTFYE